MHSPEELISSNLGLAVHIARRYGNIPGIDAEDVTAAARLALVRAPHHFDPASDRSFGPYAARAIENALVSLYWNQRRHCDTHELACDAKNEWESEAETDATGADVSEDVSAKVARRQSGELL